MPCTPGRRCRHPTGGPGRRTERGGAGGATVLQVCHGQRCHRHHCHRQRYHRQPCHRTPGRWHPMPATHRSGGPCAASPSTGRSRRRAPRGGPERATASTAPPRLRSRARSCRRAPRGGRAPPRSSPRVPTRSRCRRGTRRAPRSSPRPRRPTTPCLRPGSPRRPRASGRPRSRRDPWLGPGPAPAAADPRPRHPGRFAPCVRPRVGCASTRVAASGHAFARTLPSIPSVHIGVPTT